IGEGQHRERMNRGTVTRTDPAIGDKSNSSGYQYCSSHRPEKGSLVARQKANRNLRIRSCTIGDVDDGPCEDTAADEAASRCVPCSETIAERLVSVSRLRR